MEQVLNACVINKTVDFFEVRAVIYLSLYQWNFKMKVD